MSYVQRNWKITWKKRDQRGDFWCVVCSKKDADRFEGILNKDKELEFVKITDPDLEPGFKLFTKK